ncbi:MAG: DUF4242 domain-containing protein [Gemmatimonadaceae bacterium]
MPRYLIERDIPNVGSLGDADFKGITETSNEVLGHLGPEIRWLHSYVTGDRIYCIYEAPSEALIREHAARGGFPADRIAKISRVIDPASGGKCRDALESLVA